MGPVLGLVYWMEVQFGVPSSWCASGVGWCCWGSFWLIELFSLCYFFGWSLPVPGCGPISLGFLGCLSPGCGRVLFPLLLGCGIVLIGRVS